MKKIVTKKISLSLMVVMLMVAGIATAGYCDSFVDDHVLNALDGFKFGQSNTFSTKTSGVETQSIEKLEFAGDSFVDAHVVEALKDFRFGSSEEAVVAEKVSAPVEEKVQARGDSFVDTKTLEHMEGFVFLKGVPAQNNRIADHGGNVGNN